MSGSTPQVMGWPAIIGILVIFGLAVGMVLGVIDRYVGLTTSMTTGGVGVAVGSLGAYLVSRRRAALARPPAG